MTLLFLLHIHAILQNRTLLNGGTKVVWFPFLGWRRIPSLGYQVIGNTSFFDLFRKVGIWGSKRSGGLLVGRRQTTEDSKTLKSVFVPSRCLEFKKEWSSCGTTWRKMQKGRPQVLNDGRNLQGGEINVSKLKLEESLSEWIFRQLCNLLRGSRGWKGNLDEHEESILDFEEKWSTCLEWVNQNPRTYEIRRNVI